MKIQCIVLARGGSKGIVKKNITNFCGKPLLAWTIEQFKSSEQISNVWVSSDDDEILNIADKYGARLIKRPEQFSGDNSTSESAWLHAIDHLINNLNEEIDIVIAPQVTSPLRELLDIDNSINKFVKGGYDSLFSASTVEDLFFWENTNNGLQSINYDYKNRKRRQDSNEQIIENGSFYLFKPKILKNNNRIGGKIGFSKMDFWKMFEIDNNVDLKMCSALMKEFLIKDK